jgi:hypothetical protein
LVKVHLGGPRLFIDRFWAFLNVTFVGGHSSRADLPRRPPIVRSWILGSVPHLDLKKEADEPWETDCTMRGSDRIRMMFFPSWTLDFVALP